MGDMSGAPELTLFELCGRDDVRFSPYCWRTRYALAHKGLHATRIPTHFTEKEKIAASGHKRVPVLRDGERWVGDSWDIACYLEARHAQPTLFPGGRALTYVFNRWVDRELHPLILRVIAQEIHERVDPIDRDYFLHSREERLGGTLESFAARREEFLALLAPKLAELERALAESPFLAGDAPAYADYVLAGTFEWIAHASTLAVPSPGSRLATWFERIREHHRSA